jgi:hypothetical protein
MKMKKNCENVHTETKPKELNKSLSIKVVPWDLRSLALPPETYFKNE